MRHGYMNLHNHGEFPVSLEFFSIGSLWLLFSDGATYIRQAAITFGIGARSSYSRQRSR